jgi:hypothetical protein
VLRSRECKLCHSVFQIERKPGKPREYCTSCQPVGWKLVKKRGRLKLRRWPPMLPSARMLSRRGGEAA